MKEFNLRILFITNLKIIFALGIVVLAIFCLNRVSLTGVEYFFISCSLSVVLITLTFYFIVLNSDDKQYAKKILNNIKNKVFKI